MTARKVSYDDVELAFQTMNAETAIWLDRETGDVLYLTDDMRLMLDEDPDDIPDWARADVVKLRRCLRALGELDNDFDEDDAAAEADAARYVAIPNRPSYEAFQEMEEFVALLDEERDGRVVNDLIRALRGPKPFRRFKDTLRDYPTERERWFKFENERLRARISEWAEDEGVALDFGRKD